MSWMFFLNKQKTIITEKINKKILSTVGSLRKIPQMKSLITISGQTNIQGENIK